MRFEDFYRAFELIFDYLAERLNPFYRFYETGSGGVSDSETSSRVNEKDLTKKIEVPITGTVD